MFSVISAFDLLISGFSKKMQAPSVLCDENNIIKTGKLYNTNRHTDIAIGMEFVQYCKNPTFEIEFAKKLYETGRVSNEYIHEGMLIIINEE